MAAESWTSRKGTFRAGWLSSSAHGMRHHS